MGNSDSRAQFVEGVNRLLSEEVPSDDDSFWQTLFSSQMQVEDVFEIIGPDHVRQLKRKKPKNLQVFLRQTVGMMELVCGTSDRTGTLTPQVVVGACNAIRLLTRIVPFLLEEPDDPVCEALLWNPGGLDDEPAQAEGSDGAVAAEATPKSPAAEGATAEADPAEAAASNGNGTTSPPKQTVLADDILHYLMRFLFLPDYCVAPKNGVVGKEKTTALPTHRVDARVVWRGGIGVSKELPCIQTQMQFKTRIEVLRCLLACLSGPLFQSSDDFQEKPSP